VLKVPLCASQRNFYTYLQELLIYKFLSQHTVTTAGKFENKSLSQSIIVHSLCENSLDRTCATLVGATTVQDGYVALVGHLSLPDPILALRKIDMTDDGLLEIGVLSLKGLHILQVYLYASDAETLFLILLSYHSVAMDIAIHA